jgi:putative spermidine/putrescine transport system ATP-binding protein
MPDTATGRTGRSASVRLEAITKTIGSTRILAGVDLDVAAGEFVTLLGPSGSGKTSTLMVVAGFVVPDSGRILVGGRDLTATPPGRERDMGIVFQNYALFPHMSVAQNVAYPLKVRRLPRREVAERVDRVLDLVQLGPLAGRRPAGLSGGQQQRVALARALVFEPSVLLMDEPMGALDVRLKEELQWEIRRLRRAIGATILYVTHDQNEAMLMSDRIALMRDGRIEQLATAQDLYRHPASLFAARFLGESNILTGRYRAGPAPALIVAGKALALPPGAGAGRIADGAPAAALLRPEALTLAPAGQAAGADTDAAAAPAVVRDIAFVGQSVRYEVDAALSPAPILVQQLARASQGERAPGSAVRLIWDPADIHLMPAEDDDG